MYSDSIRKQVLAFMAGIFLPTLIVSQSVGINTTAPHTSAILDVKSGTKGMLIPRTSTTSRTAIVSPAKGLMIYDTTTSSFWFYNGAAWTSVADGNSTWGLSGNAGINPANHFIGTTDEQPLRFRINNGWAGEIHPTNGNVFIGLGSGQANTTGAANTAMGERSLLVNTTGAFNTAYGYESLSGNTSGLNNTAHGGYSLYKNTTGNDNTAIGRNALFANTTGSSNTSSGKDALLSNTTGNYNTANGAGALFYNTSGQYNTASGKDALFSNTIGNYNAANGASALYNNTTGDYNTANGVGTLLYNTTGNSNTANGYFALYSNTTGSQNTAIGDYALAYNSTANQNTATGSEALRDNSDGAYNTADGFAALQKNTTGALNTASGHGALYNNTTGWINTAFGRSALYNNTTGDYNIAIGNLSGTGGPNGGILYNTVGIGNDGAFLNGASNQVILGNTSTVFIGGKVNWGVISDARIKHSVEEDVKGLSFILKLRPVTYHVSNKAITDLTGNKDTINFPGKFDGEKIKYTGFLAQEVEQAAKATGFDFSGYTVPKNSWEMYTIRYAEFVVPLVKAMQEQQSMIETLRMQVEAAKAEIPMQIGKQQSIITNQQKQIDLLEKRLSALEAKK